MRDGHGDLLAEDVFCLDDGPRFLDCLAFDDRLRHADVLADAAFLAMDIEAHGAEGLGRLMLETWSRALDETHPASLADHYVAYRAHVRAKVACLRHVQGDPEAAHEARRLHDLCLRHLERARVRLVLVGGAPGTGKSTVAAALGERTGWHGPALRRRPRARRRPSRERAAARPGTGPAATPPSAGPRCTPPWSRRLPGGSRPGESVILDASWSAEAERARAREAARSTRSEIVEIRCEAPADVAARRIAERAARGDDPSEATAGDRPARGGDAPTHGPRRSRSTPTARSRGRRRRPGAGRLTWAASSYGRSAAACGSSRLARRREGCKLESGGGVPGPLRCDAREADSREDPRGDERPAHHGERPRAARRPPAADGGGPRAPPPRRRGRPSRSASGPRPTTAPSCCSAPERVHETHPDVDATDAIEALLGDAEVVFVWDSGVPAGILTRSDVLAIVRAALGRGIGRRHPRPCVLRLAGPAGAGKTTLIIRTLPLLGRIDTAVVQANAAEAGDAGALAGARAVDDPHAHWRAGLTRATYAAGRRPAHPPRGP